MQRKRKLAASAGVIVAAVGCLAVVHVILSSHFLASETRARRVVGDSTRGASPQAAPSDDWLAERLALQLENRNLRRQLADAHRRPGGEAAAAGGGIADEVGGGGADEPNAAVAHGGPTLPAIDAPKNKGNEVDAASFADWLVVGIPTVPRRGEDTAHLIASCLYRTVWSYVAQLAAMEGGLASRIRVVVVNHRPGGHTIFNAVKRAILALHLDAYYGAAARRVSFHEGAAVGAPAGGYRDDATIMRPGGDGGGGASHEAPTAQVRRQSLDVVQMLDYVVLQPSRYFLFTEDDFELCRNGLLALQYMTAKAHRNAAATVAAAQGRAGTASGRATTVGSFTALRCGIGLNGIVMHNSKELPDVREFRNYLLRHYARRPPDHLVVEFFAKETPEAAQYFGSLRRAAAFRHNIFLHTGGRKSTLRPEDAWSTPSCFTELIVPQLFEVEAWDPRQCPGDDVWPCDGDTARSEQSAMGGGVVLRWNVSKAAQVSQHWVASPDDN